MIPAPTVRLAYIVLTLILWTRGLEQHLWDAYFALMGDLAQQEGHETGDEDTNG